MPHDPQTLLRDMQQCGERILRFTAGLGLDEYLANEMIRSAVERQFSIIGEALSRLRKVDPILADRIPENRQIMSFRNIIIHGYDGLDDKIVWGVIEKDIRELLRQLDILLKP